MSHSILSLQAQRFDVRLMLGGCLININGETVDCRIEVDKTNFTSPTYSVFDKYGRELCYFRPFNLFEGPTLYQIERATAAGGDATLIVPSHGLTRFDPDGNDDDPDSDDMYG